MLVKLALTYPQRQQNCKGLQIVPRLLYYVDCFIIWQAFLMIKYVTIDHRLPSTTGFTFPQECILSLSPPHWCCRFVCRFMYSELYCILSLEICIVLIQRIISSFAEVKKIILLAGDCFVSHDDARWQVCCISWCVLIDVRDLVFDLKITLFQSAEFETFAKHLKPTYQDGHQRECVFRIPFFDPPLISPHDSALAVPVSVHGLWAAFMEVCDWTYYCVFHLFDIFLL
mgnify:CR=1 FL=1